MRTPLPPDTKPKAKPTVAANKPKRGFGSGVGRKKGTKNRKTMYREALDKVKSAKAEYDAQIHHTDPKTGIKYDKFNNPLGEYYGETPLEFMIGVMLDPKAPTRFRFQAAKDSAPYRHAKLATIEVRSKNVNVDVTANKDGEPLTADEAARAYQALLGD